MADKHGRAQRLIILAGATSARAIVVGCGLVLWAVFTGQAISHQWVFLGTIWTLGVSTLVAFYAVNGSAEWSRRKKLVASGAGLALGMLLSEALAYVAPSAIIGGAPTPKSSGPGAAIAVASVLVIGFVAVAAARYLRAALQELEPPARPDA